MRTIAATLLISVFSLPVFAQNKSDQNQKREQNAAGGWTVLYGTAFAEREYIEAGEAIVESVKNGDPGPFLQFMATEIAQSAMKIQKQFPDIGYETLVRLLAQSIQQGKFVRIQNLDVAAGVLTINRWVEVGTHVPEFHGLNIKWVYKKARTDLQPHFNPYIKYRIRLAQNPAPQDGLFIPPPPGGNAQAFPQQVLPFRPISLTVRCNDKQEVGSDQIVLIINTDKRRHFFKTDEAGLSHSRPVDMEDGRVFSLPPHVLKLLYFTRYVQVTVVECDTINDNDVLGTVTFKANDNASHTIRHGSLGRRSSYTVSLNSKLPPKGGY